MSDQLYREQLLDHYKNPRNYGNIADATSTAELQNLSCGDEIKMHTKIDGDVLSDIKFEGEGCAICIASASILIEESLGKSKKHVLDMSFSDLQKIIGIEVSPSRIKCAHLGLLTLKKALGSKGNSI